MLLRPYQTQLIEDVDAALDDCRSVCAVLPTGGGKTVCFSSMALAISDQGASVWALAHREELVNQMSQKFLDFGVGHGIIKARMPMSASPIQVGMIQTTKNRLSRLRPPDILIIDECHHTPASQYAAILNSMPESTKIVGFTATPCRLDGKGLGQFYDKLVEGPGIADLIGMGYLAPPKVFAPELVDTSALHRRYGDFVQGEVNALFEEPRIYGDAFEWYMRIAPLTSAVAFCPSISIALQFARRFNNSGVRSEAIYGDLGSAKITDLLRRFREKEILCLFSVALIDEGFDCPGIETVLDYAPTESLSRWLQRLGRGLRPQEGKLFATYIDHVGNRYRHGDPTAARDWSLDGAMKRDKDEEEIELRTCQVCKLVYTGRMCPECKVEEMRVMSSCNREEIEMVEHNLVEVQGTRNWITKDELEQARKCEDKGELEQFAASIGVPFEIVRDKLIKNAGTFEELTAAGRTLGYASGWAKHRFWARHGNAPKPDVGAPQ